MWIDSLLTLTQTSVKLPTVLERVQIERQFRNLAGFPGVVGVIDGCHINVMAPSQQQASYREEHGQYIFFLPGQHMLGDKIYPLKEWLLPPFKDYGNIMRMQTNYNMKHSKTRVKIENCFGLLKGRWRRLKYVQVYRIEKATKIVMACALLQNFCIINNDLAGTLKVLHDELCVFDRVLQNDRPQNRNYNRQIAVDKKDNIMRMLA